MKNILVSMAALVVAVVAFDVQAFKKATTAKPAVSSQSVVAPLKPVVKPVVDVAQKVAERQLSYKEFANLITDQAAKSATVEDAEEYVEKAIIFLQANVASIRNSIKFKDLPHREGVIAKEQEAIQEAHHAELLKQANEKATTQAGIAYLEQYEKEHPGVDLSALKLKVQVK